MDNAQNLDNINNIPMTSSSNSTYRISKDKYLYLCIDYQIKLNYGNLL